MPPMFNNPIPLELFDRLEPPSSKHSTIRRRILETERSNTIGEPDLERVLPDSGDMKGIFWAWDRHARISLCWPQLEPFTDSRRDVELAESLGTTGGRSAFVRLNERGFQVPSFFVCDSFAVHTPAQALLLTAVENWIVRGRGSSSYADYLARLCQCHDSAEFRYIDADGVEGTARVRHRLEWLCLLKACRVFSWFDFEIVRKSRIDREFTRLTSFQAFARNGTHLDLGCYPNAPLLVLQKFAPPEGLWLPPLMTLTLYGCHLSRLQTKTIEQARRQGSYINKEFARFLRLLIVEFAWSVVVCVTLECRQNGRVPVLTGRLIALVEAVVGGDDAFLPGLGQAKAKDAIVNMKRALVCNPQRFLLRRFHLCDKPTAFARMSDLPRMPHVSVLLAHGWSWPTSEWLHSELEELYRSEHRRSFLFDNRHGPTPHRVAVAPLGEYLRPVPNDMQQRQRPPLRVG